MDRGRSSRLRLATLAVLGLLLAYVVTLPPHLVHHLFEDDRHHDQHHRDEPPCPHLALSLQTADLSSDVPATLVPPTVPAITGVAVVSERPPAPSCSAENPRAPPHA